MCAQLRLTLFVSSAALLLFTGLLRADPPDKSMPQRHQRSDQTARGPQTSDEPHDRTASRNDQQSIAKLQEEIQQLNQAVAKLQKTLDEQNAENNLQQTRRGQDPEYRNSSRGDVPRGSMTNGHPRGHRSMTGDRPMHEPMDSLDRGRFHGRFDSTDPRKVRDHFGPPDQEDDNGGSTNRRPMRGPQGPTSRNKRYTQDSQRHADVTSRSNPMNQGEKQRRGGPPDHGSNTRPREREQQDEDANVHSPRRRLDRNRGDDDDQDDARH